LQYVYEGLNAAGKGANVAHAASVRVCVAGEPGAAVVVCRAPPRDQKTPFLKDGRIFSQSGLRKTHRAHGGEGAVDLQRYFLVNTIGRLFNPDLRFHNAVVPF
jgi:hypothetical protein